MEIVFASNNHNKLKEIQMLVPKKIKVLSLNDIQFFEEIEETGDTLEENAAIKARAIFEFCQLPCFADDSGLMVEAINGQPGVKSARYAGEPADNNKNMLKLLKALDSFTNRNAKFQTVICYKSTTHEVYFNGEVSGEIISEMRGEKGFGYDPIFMPFGYQFTFAQMSQEEKNKISHRKKAIAKMLTFFDTL